MFISKIERNYINRSRIGAMIAPQTPLLVRREPIFRGAILLAAIIALLFQANYFLPLPAFLFGGTSIVSCFLVLLLPETFNMKLPDTIDEAEGISK